MWRAAVFILTFFLTASFQQFSDNPASISDFTLPDVVSGNNFSLSQFSDAKAVVVVFTSHYCPYAKLYQDRLKKLIEQYQPQQVRFVLINSNNPAKSTSDSRENMIKKVGELNISVPYLSDHEQKVADLLGAHKTPEVFMLKKNGAAFEIMYRGAIDDNPQVATDVKHHFLQDAIETALKGRRPAQASIHPTGCMIKR